MKTKLIIVLVTIFFFGALESLPAQDPGPQFKKVSEGIYVYAAVLNEANSTIVLTQDGVVEKQMATSPEMRAAFKDFRLITPHIYHDRMTLNVDERTMELYYFENVYSEADSAIWLPKERVLFTAASVGVKRFGNHRPFVSIPDTLSAIKMMKALNPQVVIPGHGNPGTAKILDDMENYYSKLMEGVRQMVKEGKSLDQIKKELKIPGTEDWEGQDRLGNNIEAAHRAVIAR